jgi:hypothetical protein
MGLPQVQVVDAGQGAAVHADEGHGRKLPQLCQFGLKILPGPAIFGAAGSDPATHLYFIKQFRMH